MKKQKKSSFAKKFYLLNSQDSNSNDISWSSSESSDFENLPNKLISTSSEKFNHRKRKRKKTPKNISNLDITIINVPELQKVPTVENQSSKTKDTNEVNFHSPILRPGRQYFPCNKCDDTPTNTSPILLCKSSKSEPKNDIKSPVLLPRHTSPGMPSNIRKKLFKTNYSCDIANGQISNISNLNKNSLSINTSTCDFESILNIKDVEHPSKLNDKQKEAKTQSEVTFSNQPNHKKHLDLVKKVESYFNNQFSSESASQHSISECDTPTPDDTCKSSEDIEILNSLTQAKSITALNQEITVDNLESCNSSFNQGKSKKVKYKKDGLAYRLSNLLRKQNANVSLWKHERFLATNSNFVIPKSEYLLFRIQKLQFKYGVYLLDSIDLEDAKYLILINSIYVDNCNICPNAVFKLYEPYNILNFTENFKLIVNVCKFECIYMIEQAE